MNICQCGAQAGYPHRDHCPYPYYGDEQGRVDKWTYDWMWAKAFYAIGVVSERYAGESRQIVTTLCNMLKTEHALNPNSDPARYVAKLIAVANDLHSGMTKSTTHPVELGGL